LGTSYPMFGRFIVIIKL